MLNALKVRWAQGYQTVDHIRQVALNQRFRGLPVIESRACPEDCQACVEVCPSQAIQLSPVRIDLGKCIFCPDCGQVCPAEKIHFTPDYHLSCNEREGLVVGSQAQHPAVKTEEKIRQIFGRSLKLRSVSAGGCNGCEMELNALANVNFDMGRFGIEFTASPRHADGLVLTGPISENMAPALQATFDAIPSPKIVIAVGACGISGGVFAASPALDRRFLEKIPVDLYIPGCPPHPLTFLNGLLDLLGKKYS
ncbi:MAG: NADH-quinone oxidoreductase subunit NuoB [SAR324 cluster bacterium]|nr:NADH-quinone oxidoreductase subunit NuoB [SAR324 cluster bacterium]